MALDSVLLGRARELLQRRKVEREKIYEARKESVYAQVPELRQVEAALQKTVLDAVKITLDRPANPEALLERLGIENRALQEKSRKLLIAADLPVDYLDEQYLCTICEDSFHDGVKHCTCLLQVYKEVQVEELGKLLNLGDANFANFSLKFYDDFKIYPTVKRTAKEQMRRVFDSCKEYAEKFELNKSTNLLFVGEPGLGKTFLSSAIAERVSARGFSVVYDTANRLFSQFEQDKFGKSADAEAVQEEISRYLSCDLLILDDLGTELTTSFVVSALYTLINTRILQNKPTIITSNYSLEALGDRYSPQIMSRLEGEFAKVTFVGQDIRKQKKEQ